MANAYADEQASLMWDAIIAIIQKEMNVGPTGPGSGSNPNGRLQTLKMVHESIDLWSNLLPAVGVQLEEIDCTEMIGMNQAYAKITFQILVATVAANNPTTGLIILDDAMKQLRVLLADGQGNGLGPVFRDSANFTLNGTCNESKLEGWKLKWQLPNDADADARAVAFGTLVARQKVFIYSPPI